MIVADILMWFLLIAGTSLVINAYWLTTQLFPGFVDRCRDHIRTAPARRFLICLAITVPAVVAGIAILRAPNPILKFSVATLLLLQILTGLRAPPDSPRKLAPASAAQTRDIACGVADSSSASPSSSRLSAGSSFFPERSSLGPARPSRP